ncbi:hypothetical protein Acr_00g0057300 [Actinidia rufa]|uniref:Uncharacterized protein n=1 Tax=Actinidia rufa TaxID=165716 RepID=A0A7J0DMK2_9ERIC|nr:hypothetical protein Acr_00g0057300 [Actinidia rufa]
MANEVTQLPSSPREDPSSFEGSLSNVLPSPIDKDNIMTQGELDYLRESCSFPSRIQARILEDGETVLSTHLGELVQKSKVRLIGALFQGEAEQYSEYGVPQQRQGVNKKVLLHLGGGLGVFPGYISRRKSSAGPKIIGHPRARRIFPGPSSPRFLNIPKVFVLDSERMASSGGDNAENNSIEYIGTIKKKIKKNLPPLPDLTLLRLLGKKSDHTSLGLAMSKIISLKKLTQKVGESKGESLATKSTLTAKRVVIGKKRPREVFDTFPNKKGKSSSIAKDKGTTLPSAIKKKAMWNFIEPPSKEVSKAVSVVAVREGTSVNPVATLGPESLY